MVRTVCSNCPTFSLKIFLLTQLPSVAADSLGSALPAAVPDCPWPWCYPPLPPFFLARPCPKLSLSVPGPDDVLRCHRFPWLGLVGRLSAANVLFSVAANFIGRALALPSAAAVSLARPCPQLSLALVLPPVAASFLGLAWPPTGPGPGAARALMLQGWA